MIIYESSKSGFIDDVEGKLLQPKLESAFENRTGWIPDDRRGWEAAYGEFKVDLQQADVDNDVRVAIEYHLSAAGRFRIDVLLAGNDRRCDRALIVELKGWKEAEATDIPELVRTPFASGPRLVTHPSVQALGYREMVLAFNEDVERLGIDVQACAYLHNLRKRSPEPLECAQYAQALAQAPAFFVSERRALREHLARLVPLPSRTDVIHAFEHGRMRPTRQLIDAVDGMLSGNPEFRLIDEQRVAFNRILHHLLDAQRRGERKAFVVEGGPGTGKSVIAIRLLAELYRREHMARFIAPNRAFRNTIAEHLSRSKREARRRAKVVMGSAWSFHDADWERDRAHDVLIVDEAHRLKSGAVNHYRGDNMVADMIRAARVCVFFVDPTQRVAWNDCGTREEIVRQAQTLGVEVEELPALAAQFRCNGSDGYLNWVDQVLQIRPTANFDTWGDGRYEFQVFDDARELHQELLRRNIHNRARLIAGYAWEWPKLGRARNGARRHVEAGGLRLPWNYDGENWATAKDGIEQVGCVHTCQGVEFDHVGVLIGEDLVFREGRVRGLPEKRARTDKSLHGWKRDLRAAGSDDDARKVVLERVQSIIRNTYKVLLTRGRQSCLVWCADAALRDHLRKRAAAARSDMAPAVEQALRVAETEPGYESNC